MSVLSELVHCACAWTGTKREFFQEMPKEVRENLKSVTQLQRRKFDRHGKVPLQVLEALWLLGFLPNDRTPGRVLGILELTEYLRKGKYRTENSRDRGNWLYHRIMKEEVIGIGKPLQSGPEMKLPCRCEQCTFYDVSVSPSSNFAAQCKHRGGLYCPLKER
jgi:hypothetical protein